MTALVSPAVAGTPRMLLRVEGLALFALATAGFGLLGLSWWLYALLFFTPDVSLLAYRAGARRGALLYNALHTTIGPALVAALGLVADSAMLLGFAAIFAAHIGFDRMLGYGLKYETAFGDTHLGRIGRSGTGA